MPKFPKPKPAAPKHKKELALLKTIAEMKEQLDLLTRNKMAEKRRARKGKRLSIPSSDLIPRPKGRPGRGEGKGYRLIDELGLTENREQYYHICRTIRRLAIKYLDTSCTLTKQRNNLLVEKIIRDVQFKLPILMKYENGWPVRDLLAQYLRNSAQGSKKDDALNVTMAGISNGASDTEEDSDQEIEDGVDDLNEASGDEESEDSESDIETDEEHLLESEPKAHHSQKARQVPTEPLSKAPHTAHDDTSTAPLLKLPKAHHSQKARQVPTEPLSKAPHTTLLAPPNRPQKRLQVEDESESNDDHRSPKRWRAAKDSMAVSSHNGPVSPLAAPYIPTICPDEDCQDIIPNDISERLRSALLHHATLAEEGTTDLHLDMEICLMIKRALRRKESIESARRHQWPVTEIDFKAIPNRILDMYNKLTKFILDPQSDIHIFGWTCFEHDLKMDGLSVSQFARTLPTDIPINACVWRNARGGYYGSKGSAIVLHTLLQLFRPENLPRTVFKDLPTMHYFCYLATPHVVTQLIAQDLKIPSMSNARETLVASSNVGESINPEDDNDEELDTINSRTTTIFRGIPAQHPQRVEMAARTLTLLQNHKQTKVGDHEALSRPTPRIRWLRAHEGANHTSEGSGSGSTSKANGMTSSATNPTDDLTYSTASQDAGIDFSAPRKKGRSKKTTISRNQSQPDGPTTRSKTRTA